MMSYDSKRSTLQDFQREIQMSRIFVVFLLVTLRHFFYKFCYKMFKNPVQPLIILKDFHIFVYTLQLAFTCSKLSIETVSL